MKRHFFTLLIFISSFGFLTNLSAQNRTISQTNSPSSPTDNLAKKRTQRMKDELFLSQEQDAKVLEINKDMLLKLEALKQKNLAKADYKKSLDQIENTTKNKIVSLLTPAQRQRFETKLFTEIYQTKVDKKNAVSVYKKNK